MDEHCMHCEDHELRLRGLEIDERVRAMVLAFMRWGIPILVTATGILVAVVTATR